MLSCAAVATFIFADENNSPLFFRAFLRKCVLSLSPPCLPQGRRKWDRRSEFFHIFSQVKVAERWVIFGALRSVQIRPDMEFENIAFFRSIQHQTIGIPCELSIRVNYRLFSPIPEAAKAKIIFSDCRFPRNVTSEILRLRWMLWGTLKYRDSSLDREC